MSGKKRWRTRNTPAMSSLHPSGAATLAASSFDASGEYSEDEDSEEREDGVIGFSGRPVVDGNKHHNSSRILVKPAGNGKRCN